MDSVIVSGDFGRGSSGKCLQKKIVGRKNSKNGIRMADI
jgi:hypothetical protein